MAEVGKPGGTFFVWLIFFMAFTVGQALNWMFSPETLRWTWYFQLLLLTSPMPIFSLLYVAVNKWDL
jgi:hypothetical protein